jgi:hypothetical protein
MPILDGFRVAAEVVPSDPGFVSAPATQSGRSIINRGYEGLTAADVARLFAGYQASHVSIDRVRILVVVEPTSPGGSVPLLPENFAWANSLFVAQSASTEARRAKTTVQRSRPALHGGTLAGGTLGQPASATIFGDVPAASASGVLPAGNAGGIRPLGNAEGIRPVGNAEGIRPVGNAEVIRPVSPSSGEGAVSGTGGSSGNLGGSSISGAGSTGNSVGSGGPAGSGSNGPGSGPVGTVISVPTPSSLLLAFSGLLGMLALRRPRDPR